MALEWLKPILGDGYTDDIDTKISQEIGKSFVPRADFNAKNTTLKTVEQLQALQGKADSVDALQTQVTTLTQQLAAKEADFNAQLADRDFNDKLTAAGQAARVRDMEAVKPFLDVDALKASKNQDADIKAAFEKVKQDKSYLFDGEVPPKMVSFTGGANEQTQSDNTKANNAIRSLFGKE